jgi:hypothetical protein
MRSANRRSDSSSTIPSRDREHRPAHHTGAAKNLEYTATPHGHRDAWRREHRTRDRGRRDVPQRRADTTGAARPSNDLSSSGGGRMWRMATNASESSGSVVSSGQRTGHCTTRLPRAVIPTVPGADPTLMQPAATNASSMSIRSSSVAPIAVATALEFAHAPRFAPHSRYTRRRYASCWVVSLITAPSGYRTPVRPDTACASGHTLTMRGSRRQYTAIVPALTKGPACRVKRTRYRCRTSSRPDRISIQCAATSSKCVSRTAGVGASPRICASSSRCSDSSSRASGSYRSRSPASSA